MTEPQTMSGKTCIVTGANSGIGKETALGLARMGAHVVLVCRNAEKGRAALADIQRESGSSKLDLLIADMSSMAAVRALTAQILEKYPRVDVLINNAGTGHQQAQAFRRWHRNDHRRKPSRSVSSNAAPARPAEGQRAFADRQRFIGGAAPRASRYGRYPIRAPQVLQPWGLRAVESADERVHVRTGSQAEGDGRDRELPSSGRGCDEYLAFGRGRSAAVLQDSCRDLQAAHDRFEERRAGVALSRRFPGRRRSHWHVFREIEAC